MSTQELVKLLDKIDGKGYKSYKDLKGKYQFSDFLLSIDYVQGDPYASPSRIRVEVPGEKANFPSKLFDTPYKKRAAVDFLSRTCASNIGRFYKHVGGSGKSGLLSIGSCGQEMLERNFVVVDQNRVEARLEVGLPAAGRKILGNKAKDIFISALPKIVEASLFYENVLRQELKKKIQLAEDQHVLRDEIKKRALVAFVANGSNLPRESGISQHPLKKGAVAFQSPVEYEVKIDLPHHGPIYGMGIPQGVTLIVGGGFHGKTTLLNSIELGIYDHIAGDGREYVVSSETAVKIKAENNRSVEKVDISPFINNLPMKQDTVRFSTENASGSTSQAANIVEALETDAKLLLIDEDTSATNFMIRDGRMQQLVEKEKEPITPFIDKVRELYENSGVSTILVIGGSGDYFDVADHVIMMDEYVPKDATEKAKRIAKSRRDYREKESSQPPNKRKDHPRVLKKASFPKGRKGVKIKPRGIHQISYNKTNVELTDLEQLIDSNQTNAIGFMFQYIMEKLADDQKTLAEIVDEIYCTAIEKGLDEISPFQGHPGNLALPRKHEIAGALNRFRHLNIK